METLKDIHSIAIAELKKKFTLNPVSLTHPFPERPTKILFKPLIKMDGNIFSADKFTRITFLRINLPVYMCVRSTFLRPRIELDLPVMSAECVIMGGKRMFMVDVHRTGEGERPGDKEFFDRLVKIRDKYPDLLKNKTKTGGDQIQTVFSRAVCQAKTTAAQDGDALKLFREYLGEFCELAKSTKPLAGSSLEEANKKYADYLKTVVDHDPGVKGYKMFFGEEGGVQRSMEMFFNS